MVFSSPIFLFLFLPVFLLLYGTLMAVSNRSADSHGRRRAMSAANGLLLVASLLFYFWGEQWIILVMLTSTTIDYCCGLYIGRSNDLQKRRTAVLVSVAANLSLLGFFKYLNFGVDAVNTLLHNMNIAGDGIRLGLDVALPLGISFYTFQSMSYTIDVYRGVVRPNKRFGEFACYVTMFPQLVAGPIIRYQDIGRQLAARTVTRDGFAEGCTRFVVGLGKKVLIADTLAVGVDGIFAVPGDRLTFTMAWLGLFAFVVQVYHDFAGYSDMAIGLGRMLGFRFKENFNYPYVATSVTEFWRRWHISLSTWFRDYCYRPLRGERGGAARRYQSLFVVFVLIGLWHGANWTFIAFGIYHASFVVIERAWLARRLSRVPPLLGYCYAIPVIYTSFLIFRAESMEQVLSFLRVMVGNGEGDNAYYNAAMYFSPEVTCALIAGAVFCMPVGKWLSAGRRKLTTGLLRTLVEPSMVTGQVAFLCVVLLLSLISVSANTYTPFIYFRF